MTHVSHARSYSDASCADYIGTANSTLGSGVVGEPPGSYSMIWVQGDGRIDRLSECYNFIVMTLSTSNAVHRTLCGARTLLVTLRGRNNWKM